MALIDFDEKFQLYIGDWIRDNRSRFATIDQMEEQVPEVYLRWLNTPHDWLNGLSPADYFNGFKDAGELIDLLIRYAREGVPVPDSLQERIVALKDESEPILAELLSDSSQLADVRLLSIALLEEMGSRVCPDAYIELVRARAAEDELADRATDALASFGRGIVPRLIEELGATQNPYAQESFLDILCNYPGSVSVRDCLVDCFRTRSDKRALFASYIGKYGDVRARKALEESLSDPELSYLDYLEIANAIERLGGIVRGERDFAGDADYEALKGV